MTRAGRYPQELRERAVRMVIEHRDEYDSEWEAMRSIAEKLGIGTTETLRKWVRQAEVDRGVAQHELIGRVGHDRPQLVSQAGALFKLQDQAVTSGDERPLGRQRVRQTEFVAERR